jgi:hypothetical protein
MTTCERIKLAKARAQVSVGKPVELGGCKLKLGVLLVAVLGELNGELRHPLLDGFYPAPHRLF